MTHASSKGAQRQRELWLSQEATYLDIVFAVSPHRADMFLGTSTQTPEDCEKL